MFIDSENNANTNLSHNSDDGYLYHIRWYKSSSHNEAHRQDEADERWDSEFPINYLASCEDLDATISEIDNMITEVTNWDAKERVITRNNRSLENRRLDFKRLMEDRECSQQYIQEQDEEYLEKIEGVFKSQDARSYARKQEDYTLMYVAMGVGFLVLASVIIMANK